MARSLRVVPQNAGYPFACLMCLWYIAYPRGLFSAITMYSLNKLGRLLGLSMEKRSMKIGYGFSTGRLSWLIMVDWCELQC